MYTPLLLLLFTRPLTPRDEFIFSGWCHKMAASPRTTLSYSYYYYYYFIWRRRRWRRDVCMYIPAFPPPTTLSPNSPPDHLFAKASSWWEGGEKLLERTRPHPAAPFTKTLANLYQPPPLPMSTTILSGNRERLLVYILYTYCMIHIQGGLDAIYVVRDEYFTC